MFCPQCKAEYRAGFTQCSDCAVELVGQLVLAGTRDDLARTRSAKILNGARQFFGDAFGKNEIVRKAWMRLMIAFLAIAVLASLSWIQFVSSRQFVPDQWPKKELDHFLALQNDDYDSHSKTGLDASTEASKGMVASTSEALATHAGLKVLQHGGNAADAALTTSFSQIALTAGSAVSYGGIMTAVYYDAASNKVYTLNAAYNTVKKETDPLTIPIQGQHSGRMALVPGFMAGAQALHDRFGKLPFSRLLEPAIWIAEHGVTLSPLLEGWFRQAQGFVTRLPEGRRIFTKTNQQLYKAGDLFRQPALAETLKKVAAQGSGYMYKGEWARHFVDAIQREGGKITMDDLSSYRPMWTEPLRIPYGGYEVVSLGPPNIGGLMTLGSLKLAEVAEIKKYGHYTKSADALYYLIQTSRMQYGYTYMPAENRRRIFPGIDPSPEAQVSTDTAEQMLAYLRLHINPVAAPKEPGPGHSAAVIAVDKDGNVACILHSINTTLWGTTGIFVDGVSIPDSAAFQQRQIAEAGMGVRFPDPSNPLMVLKGGKPVLVSAAVGEIPALHLATLQNLMNVLDFGMDPKTAVVQPNTQGPYLGKSLTAPPRPEYEIETVSSGFSETVLDGVRARGQRIRVLPGNDQAGYWIGVQIDYFSHKISGAATSRLPSMVEGY